MAYFICLLLSVSFIYSIERGNKLSKGAYNLVYFFPLLMWSLMIGLQDNVGTDYKSYYNVFDNTSKLYKNKGELIFYEVARFISDNDLSPQLGFIFFAFVQNILLFLFLKKFEVDHLALFVFLYITLSTAFINQTNPIRQYTAIYIFMYALIFIYKRKLIPYIACIVIASLIHKSSLMLLPLYFLRRPVLVISEMALIISLLIGFLFSLFSTADLISPIMTMLGYGHYLKALVFMQQVSLLNRITKYIYIPFYLIAIPCRKELKRPIDVFLFNIGCLSFAIKLLSLSSIMLTRFTAYFEILLIFPVYFYLISVTNKGINGRKNRVLFVVFFLIMLLIMFFAVKTLVFPTREYAYKTVLFK